MANLPFPPLAPNARSYNFGVFSTTIEPSLTGSKTRFLHSRTRQGVTMSLAYTSLNEEKAELLREHYRQHDGTFKPFKLSLAALQGHAITPYKTKASTNDLRDCSMYEQTLTVVGGAARQDDSTRAKYGKGRMYFPFRSALTVASGAQLRLGASDFTIELWTSAGNGANDQTLMSRMPSRMGPGSWTLFSPGATGKVGFYVGAFDPVNPLLMSQNTVDIHLGPWHQIVVVRHGNDWILFIDGQEHNRRTWAGDIGDTPGDIVIGNDAVITHREYTGSMDNIAIYRGARHTANFTSADIVFGAEPDPNMLLCLTFNGDEDVIYGQDYSLFPVRSTFWRYASVIQEEHTQLGLYDMSVELIQVSN